jgi:hydrogenase maturation factor HypF (carbamoyltransferase family)
MGAVHRACTTRQEKKTREKKKRKEKETRTLTLSMHTIVTVCIDDTQKRALDTVVETG